jgi:hypothetical protein
MPPIPFVFICTGLFYELALFILSTMWTTAVLAAVVDVYRYSHRRRPRDYFPIRPAVWDWAWPNSFGWTVAL